MAHRGGQAEQMYKSETNQTFNARSEHQLKPENSFEIGKLFVPSFYGVKELDDLHRMYPM